MVKAWFKKAQVDIQTARLCEGAGEMFRGPLVFHCQQAAEKAIKGFLVFHKVRFPKTHDISELLKLVANIDPSLSDQIKDTKDLSKYAVAYRYPEIDEEGLKEAAVKRSLDLATTAYHELYARIPLDAFS
jgi:HEPN domain-containing protein